MSKHPIKMSVWTYRNDTSNASLAQSIMDWIRLQSESGYAFMDKTVTTAVRGDNSLIGVETVITVWMQLTL